MRSLSIDTATRAASVCLAQGRKVVYQAYMHQSLTHSQSLMPMVDLALSQAGWTIGSLDVLGVSAGPGSFTGVRIGVATIKAMAHAANKPVAGVNTLDALAMNAPGASLCAAMMDARCRQVYAALYQWRDGLPQRIMQPTAMGLDELFDLLSGYGQVHFTGDGVDTCEAELRTRWGGQAVLCEGMLRHCQAAAVAQWTAFAYEQDQLMNGYELQPVYLRAPQAEREYAARHEAGR